MLLQEKVRSLQHEIAILEKELEECEDQMGEEWDQCLSENERLEGAVVHFKKLASDAIRDKRSVLQSKLELIEDARDCEMRFIEAVEKMETFAVENERLGEMARARAVMLEATQAELVEVKMELLQSQLAV